MPVAYGNQFAIATDRKPRETISWWPAQRIAVTSIAAAT
jgi:hypothetical protein